VIAYGDLVGRALSWAQREPWFTAAASVVLVRDLLGRVRLVVEGTIDFEAEARLAAELGGWAGGMLSTQADGAAAERAIARQILSQALTPPERWPSSVPDGFGNEGPIDPKWRSYDRFSGKESWLDAKPAAPPWNLHANTPGIVAFYSFKGGVGRTTALVITAAALAARGKRVLCVDLDLEAPGLASAIGLTPTTGALDLLLEHHAHGKLEASAVTGAVHPAQIDGGPRFDVIPAAQVDETYIERVARLDYLGSPPSDQASPVEQAVVAMLRHVMSAYDVILLDARAGIHDLGGLAMLSLSHASVVVFRPDHQTLAGLDLVLPAYAARRTEDDRRLVLAASFVSERAELRAAQLRDWREQVYNRFVDVIYGDDAPALESEQAPHDLVALTESRQLSENESLQGHAAPLTAIPGYDDLVKRVELLLVPEGPP